MNAGKAVYGILSTNTDITDIVGTKIFPEVAEQESDLPLIVYQLQSVAPEDTHDGPSKLDEVRFEFLCYADTYNGAADLADKVRGALDRVSGTYNAVNVESVQFNDVDIDVINAPRRYGQVLTFTFRIKRDDVEIAQGTPVTGAMLGDLYDVNVTGVTDNQILSYDEATDSWIPADDASGLVDSVNGQTGEVSLGLDDLTDVDAGQPEAGQLLSYGQGDWTTIGQDEIEIPIASVTNLQTELDGIPTELDDLSDVKIIGTPTEGEALVYQSGFFQLGQAGATELGDLDDVNTTGAGFGSLLTYNGASWDISAGELPSDAIYFHQRFATESEALRAGATATVELYFTCTAQGNGLAESASSDTPTAGYDIRRKLYYSEEAFADPDTGTWVQFTAIADNTTFANAKAALLEYLKARTGGTVPISLKQTWEEIQQAPAFTGLLNETYGSGAEAAYSTRRLNGNVTDCMVIRRASDSTTTTIGFDGEDIDEAAITTFCTGTTCTVYQWLDQSGNGNDATAPSTGEEPTIYTGGALVKENGKVAVSFDGSNDNFISTYALNESASSYHGFVTTNAASGSGSFQTVLQGGRGHLSYDSNDTLGTNIGQAGLQSSMVMIGVRHLVEYLWNNSTGNLQLFSDGNSVAQTTETADRTATDMNIGSQSGSTGATEMNCQEIILYDFDNSSNRTDIEENVGDYFTQNTPLLDTYTGAAAAYSLRKLRTAYTGDAVEVYNGSSYADIGFNVFGELDTVALAAHCGSNDGFVSKIYDQSGNTNTAEETDTASMRKIYDATNGVMTYNGKPALFTSIFSSDHGILDHSIETGTTWTMFDVAKIDAFPFGTHSIAPYSPWAYLADGSSNSYTAGFSNTSIFKNGVELTSVVSRSDLQTALGANQVLISFFGDYTNDGTKTWRLGSAYGDNGNFNVKGYYQESIIYASAQSSTNRAGIESNIATFYGITI